MKLSAILAIAVALVSCSEESSKDEKIVDALANRPQAEPFPMPPTPGTYPFLAVLAGQGLGPIRIGATVAHVQRLMQQPCEARSENLCRYVNRGVDFNLVGGIVRSIYVQRAGRPGGRSSTGQNLKFGFFQGMIPPDLRLGMLPEAIQQHMGPPQSIERVPGPNPQDTVERHYYPGLILEYDFWHDTQKLILGGIVVVKDPNAVPPGMPDAGAPAAGGVADAGVAPSDDGGARTPRAKKKRAAAG
ncbi:MAG TPA: hypothetical protein VMS65_11205, partial [Polyangiaceae bacterium]|nr:hypothetical protein [Polyangiaceae bacterium]